MKEENKISLTEATMLALQGKLNLTEDVEIETNDVEVTIGDEKTVIEGDDQTITVEQTQTESSETVEVPVEGDETIIPEEIVDTDDNPTIDEIVDGDTESQDLNESTKVEGNKECEDCEEKIEESKLQEDSDDEEDNDEEDSEEPTEEIVDVEDETSLPTENTTLTLVVTDAESAIDAIAKCTDFLKSTETEENTVEEPAVEEPTEEIVDVEEIEENKKLNKFSSKSFNEALTKYFKKQYRVVENVKLVKLQGNNTGLKLEAQLINKDGLTKNVCLEMAQTQKGKSFTKYTLKEAKGLIKENKQDNTKVTMMTYTNKNNVLECKYLLKK